MNKPFPDPARRAADDLVYLCACTVRGETPDRARVEAMDRSLLFETAARHSLAGIAAAALERAGVVDPVFVEAGSRAIRKAIVLDAERKAVLGALNAAGIWHMPLKGSILKDYYPAIGLREMTDVDILYDRSRTREVAAIMKRLGFVRDRFRNDKDGHEIYGKPPVSTFEMHWTLFTTRAGRRIWQYYRDIRPRLLPDETGCGLHFSPEDFYVYLTAHAYKHYAFAGTGLRTLLDSYVFLRRREASLDWAYIERELETLGLSDYERLSRSLALHLFRGEPLREDEEEMLGYVLSSGAHGTSENHWQNAFKPYEDGGGRLRYALRRVFIPLDEVREVFPLFWRVPILLPLLPLYRTCRGLVMHRGALREELRRLRAMKKE